MVYLGAILIMLWGVAHLIPTTKVVAGFGNLTVDNRRILIMEWIAEGFTLCFLGGLVLVIATFYSETEAAKPVYRMVAGMLVLMAVLSAFTGARVANIFMRICPLIKTISAILILLGN